MRDGGSLDRSINAQQDGGVSKIANMPYTNHVALNPFNNNNQASMVGGNSSTVTGGMLSSYTVGRGE